MINPSNLVTKASSNTKEFMNYYVINFEDGSKDSTITLITCIVMLLLFLGAPLLFFTLLKTKL